jgi:hypothetical protein
MTKNYAGDRTFLEKHLPIVELADGPRRVLLSAALQGRVLTSTTGGGESFGWLNHGLIASGGGLPHCNNFGGEDRYWLGPEGGQYSIFFPGGSDFSFADWQTPAVIDTRAWDLQEVAPTRARVRTHAVLRNYAGTDLVCALEREVSLLDDRQTRQALGVALDAGLSAVAFRSENRLTNRGDFEWNRTTGMPSIWVLGQFVVSESNTILIPFRPAAGERINDAYFGRIGDDRLQIREGIIHFKADGRRRGKIGIPPGMTIPVCGAYDRANGVLTLVRFDFDPARSTYVNSMWEHQAEPFQGDVINAYNDGPLEDGSIMGPFCELESSSPAAALRPGETLVHRHLTVHLKGAPDALSRLAQAVLGVDPAAV